jgi:hypothetical protein
MTDAGARDRAYRRLPAHLDTIHSDERRTYWEVRKTRPQPTYTFDRIRANRDERRRRLGIPDDHQVERPGDSPADMAAARREASWQRWAENFRRSVEASREKPFDPGFVCECPPLCEELDDHSGKPVHADDCPCGCDVD